MVSNYILVDREPVLEPDLLKWAAWLEKADRHIGFDTLQNGVEVSTIFLGIDHDFSFRGPPLLFETAIFYGRESEIKNRYSTYEQALDGHKKILEKEQNEIKI